MSALSRVDERAGDHGAARPVAVEVVGLTHRFGVVEVLTGVDLTVRAGEVVGVVGPNGAGKTTLVDLLTGALPLQTGTVRIAGADVSRLPAAARTRQGLARTHQVPRPFGGLTVYENVLVGASSVADRPAAQTAALEAVDAAGLAHLVNRPAAALGLLDRKRLELARALATRPRALLLDEVAGGLTDAETADVVDLVVGLGAQGIAVLWIEHLVHVLLRATSRIVCLAQGTVIADGPPHEVVASAAVRQAYFGGMDA